MRVGFPGFPQRRRRRQGKDAAREEIAAGHGPMWTAPAGRAGGDIRSAPRTLLRWCQPSQGWRRCRKITMPWRAMSWYTGRCGCGEGLQERRAPGYRTPPSGQCFSSSRRFHSVGRNHFCVRRKFRWITIPPSAASCRPSRCRRRLDAPSPRGSCRSSHYF